MKRVLFLMAVMMLLVAGYAVAQSPTTSAPGPTLQREPGMANNDLPNPGNPQTQTGQPPAGTTLNDTTTRTTGQDTDTTGADTTTTTGVGATDTMGAHDTDTTTGGGLDNDNASLPATGSDLPLVGLTGLAALAAAAGLRRLNG